MNAQILKKRIDTLKSFFEIKILQKKSSNLAHKENPNLNLIQY